jgi:hypothetical protein
LGSSCRLMATEDDDMDVGSSSSDGGGGGFATPLWLSAG